MALEAGGQPRLARRLAFWGVVYAALAATLLAALLIARRWAARAP